MALKQEIKLDIPEGVTVTVSGKDVSLKGPKGEANRKIGHPMIAVETEGQTLAVKSVARKLSKREGKNVFTTVAHIKNMMKGVTEGHVYKLKICSGHFPMNVSVKGQEFEVKNYFGEAHPRLLKINQKTSVKVEGSDVIVEGSDLEHVSQMAASIEELTKRPGFDKRIFQDGIWIYDKDGRIL